MAKRGGRKARCERKKYYKCERKTHFRDRKVLFNFLMLRWILVPWSPEVVGSMLATMVDYTRWELNLAQGANQLLVCKSWRIMENFFRPSSSPTSWATGQLESTYILPLSRLIINLPLILVFALARISSLPDGEAGQAVGGKEERGVPGAKASWPRCSGWSSWPRWSRWSKERGS